MNRKAYSILISILIPLNVQSVSAQWLNFNWPSFRIKYPETWSHRYPKQNEISTMVFYFKGENDSTYNTNVGVFDVLKRDTLSEAEYLQKMISQIEAPSELFKLDVVSLSDGSNKKGSYHIIEVQATYNTSQLSITYYVWFKENLVWALVFSCYPNRKEYWQPTFTKMIDSFVIKK